MLPLTCPPAASLITQLPDSTSRSMGCEVWDVHRDAHGLPLMPDCRHRAAKLQAWLPPGRGELCTRTPSCLTAAPSMVASLKPPPSCI